MYNKFNINNKIFIYLTNSKSLPDANHFTVFSCYHFFL
jgi:hypothetical protein